MKKELSDWKCILIVIIGCATLFSTFKIISMLNSNSKTTEQALPAVNSEESNNTQRNPIKKAPVKNNNIALDELIKPFNAYNEAYSAELKVNEVRANKMLRPSDPTQNIVVYGKIKKIDKSFWTDKYIVDVECQSFYGSVVIELTFVNESDVIDLSIDNKVKIEGTTYRLGPAFNYKWELSMKDYSMTPLGS